MQDNRNIIIAAALSMAVLFGWQYFVAAPQMERAAKQAEIATQQKAANQAAQTGKSIAAGSAVPAGAVPPVATGISTFADRKAAIAASSRVAINTDSISGSINLTGGRLDDVELKHYHDTVDKNSPIITLLSPAGAPGAYFVEQGWAPASGTDVVVPDAKTQWQVEGGSQQLTDTSPVTLKYDNGAGLIFHRTFTIDDHYMFTVTQTVDNAGSTPVTLYPYARVSRYGMPHVQNFYILHEGPLGVLGSNNLISKKYSDLKNDKQLRFDNTSGWLGFTDKYWATAVLAKPGTPINAQFNWQDTLGFDQFQTSFVGTDAVTIAPGATGSNTSYVFAGAKEEAVISSYETKYGFDRLELLIDWGWFFFFTKPLFYLLRWLHGLLGNFGLAILTVTVIVKALFFPLANRSYASMAAMRRVQPEMKSIQERFKEDRAGQQKAMMELYKKEKINPISGCWPVLIQIPVFFSLYTVIFISLEMRHAPFFGWIQDLAAPDPTNIFTLFGLLPYDPSSIPVIGHFMMLGVWPLIMGFTMWVQMKLNPPPTDPSQAMIFNLMPILFTFMLGTFPAGLVIYWAWNNTLSVTQQWFIMKRHGAEVDLFGNILTSIGLRKPAADKAGK